MKGVKKAKVIAACDPVEEALAGVKKDFGIELTFTDYRRMLELSEIEAIICATPTHLHEKIVVAAAEAGKHVFCEKPMARTLKEADRMIEVCRQNQVNLQIGFVRRFDEEWLKFRDLVCSGMIGHPVIWRQLALGSGPKAAWYFEWEKGGGPFLDGAVHTYDFAIYTFGEVKKVKSSLGRFKKSTAPDTGSVDIFFTSGDRLHLFWSWGLPEGVCGTYTIDALGPEGILSFGVYQEKKPRWFTLKTAGGKETKLGRHSSRSLLKAFTAQLQHFVDCIGNSQTPMVDGKEGRKSLVVALEALGQWKAEKK
ncbi:MAG: Gfo/Idh/MocA family oxidoreductase, partial [Candidatus Omnitrophica bacterium]|nr:Gfo/Idh/MocA family oxidoreductase [Candidatus Omnitrophota bacterium]